MLFPYKIISNAVGGADVFEEIENFLKFRETRRIFLPQNFPLFFVVDIQTVMVGNLVISLEICNQRHFFSFQSHLDFGVSVEKVVHTNVIQFR